MTWVPQFLLALAYGSTYVANESNAEEAAWFSAAGTILVNAWLCR
jgi:hypothetical protein